ncbi:MAG TPA: glycosyltransferase family 4 protein [Gemmatimonadaceae bacterium]|nr:glycosyltransferase family 4 protein [Gemmatimonadaceae bacterium]
MSLRVLHIDTERGWRGGERQVLWLARELQRRGHVSVVAARDGEPLRQRATDAALDTISCNPVSEVDLRAVWRLRREISHRRIHIVHAHTGHAVGLAALATLGLNVPFVAARRVDFRLRPNAATRWKYGRAASVIAVSRAVGNVLADCGIPLGTIAIVPDGVDLSRTMVPASAETLASCGVNAGVPLVVQVAQLVGHKDPVNFVRAIAHARSSVPDVQAMMLGDGPLRGDVGREIRALSLEGTVHLAGFRPDADAILAAANVACLSSREEGMGSVLLDALAFGVPIAATRAGGIPEVVIDGESGLLADARDPVGLGKAIVRLLTEPSTAARLAANGRVRAAEFSVEKMTDATIEVYERVLDKPGPRAIAASSASSESVIGAP